MVGKHLRRVSKIQRTVNGKGAAREIASRRNGKRCVGTGFQQAVNAEQGEKFIAVNLLVPRLSDHLQSVFSADLVQLVHHRLILNAVRPVSRVAVPVLAAGGGIALGERQPLLIRLIVGRSLNSLKGEYRQLHFGFGGSRAVLRRISGQGDRLGSQLKLSQAEHIGDSAARQQQRQRNGRCNKPDFPCGQFLWGGFLPGIHRLHRRQQLPVHAGQPSEKLISRHCKPSFLSVSANCFLTFCRMYFT